MPEGFGKPDTVSRTYRRWAHANLWARLLVEVACPTASPILKRLTYLVCCAYRRAIRLMGTLRAILLARRAGLHSALPGPTILLPDPDLSEHLRPILPAIIRRLLANPSWCPPDGAIRGLMALHRIAAGRRRFSRWMEPA